MQDHFSERYSRQLLLPGFGAAAQEKLRAAKVLVIGAGGLGVPALQYLAGMGTGTIGIVDGDVISLSNLHRQVLYSTEDIGLPKVQVAAAKLAALNPGISIQPFHATLSPENALRIIQDYDIVLDATDNFSARYLINDACVILDKPFVYGAVHQFEGHVSVFNFKDGPTYRCLYADPPAAAEIPDCNMAGVLGIVPGIIGCWQALEAVKMITGVGKNLSGYLQVFDFLNDDQYKMKLTANPANKKLHALQESYETVSCTSDATALSPRELQEWYRGEQPFILLDVREPVEFEAGHLPGATSIPLSGLYRNPLLPIEGNGPLIIYCQQGSRSMKAALLLHRQQPSLQIFNLAGGMDSWLKSEGNL